MKYAGLAYLLKFLEEGMNNTLPSSNPFSKPTTFQNKQRAAVYSTSVSRTCKICKQEYHPLYVCTAFKALPLDKKLDAVNTQKFCHNCLAVGHHAKSCHSTHKCKKCNRANHTLLHDENRIRKNIFIPATQSTGSTGNQ